MQGLRNAVVGLVAVLAASTFVAAAAAAKPAPPPPPPPLTGTAFAGTPTITSSSCNPAGTSTFSYYVTGASVGPYTGVFEERGTVVIGPQPLGDPAEQAPLVSLTATFSIDSPTGRVDGTKSLVAPIAGAYGACLEGVTLPVLGTATIYFATASPLEYTATIRTNGAVYRDEGMSSLGSVQQTASTAFGTQGGFSEGFVSELRQPIFVGFEKRGRGCGDRNHVHERRAECPPQSQK